MKLIELLLCEGITANLFAPSACRLQSLGVEKHCSKLDSGLRNTVLSSKNQASKSTNKQTCVAYKYSFV